MVEKQQQQQQEQWQGGHMVEKRDFGLLHSIISSAWCRCTHATTQQYVIDPMAVRVPPCTACSAVPPQVAHELQLPAVIVPSLASTDAPCTALSVVYSDEGVVQEVVYFPSSPALVVVDTAVIAEAHAVFLVAGMGDAMATW